MARWGRLQRGVCHIYDPKDCIGRGLLSGISIYPDSISEAAEAALVEEVEVRFSKKRYQRNHWDQVIDNYREFDYPFTDFNAQNRSTLDAIMPLLYDTLGCKEVQEVYQKLLPDIHVLDIHGEGMMDPHVDNTEFSGGLVAGICLLSDAVMDLIHVEEDEQVALYLPRRCFYIMHGNARYQWKHGLQPPQGTFGEGQEVVRTRRISLMIRDLLP